jgi:hypothetical protein
MKTQNLMGIVERYVPRDGEFKGGYYVVVLSGSGKQVTVPETIHPKKIWTHLDHPILDRDQELDGMPRDNDQVMVVVPEGGVRAVDWTCGKMWKKVSHVMANRKYRLMFAEGQKQTFVAQGTKEQLGHTYPRKSGKLSRKYPESKGYLYWLRQRLDNGWEEVADPRPVPQVQPVAVGKAMAKAQPKVQRKVPARAQVKAVVQQVKAAAKPVPVITLPRKTVTTNQPKTDATVIKEVTHDVRTASKHDQELGFSKCFHGLDALKDLVLR